MIKQHGQPLSDVVRNDLCRDYLITGEYNHRRIVISSSSSSKFIGKISRKHAFGH